MMSLNAQINLQMIYQAIQMINNDFQKYLIQTKELFGDLLFIDKKTRSEFIQYGNINSKIVFVKNSTSNIEEKIIFQNMLRALKLSVEKVLNIDLINLNNFENSKINNALKETKSNIVVILGLDISKYILGMDCHSDSLRTNDYTIYDKKVIPTYSLKDMITDKKFKKYVWNDLKAIS